MCGAGQDWWQPKRTEQNSPDPGPAVLACLFRHSYMDEQEGGLSKTCAHEVCPFRLMIIASRLTRLKQCC